MPELMPCPFCGEKPKIFDVCERIDKTMLQRIICPCGCSFLGEENFVFHKWNNRHNPPKLKDLGGYQPITRIGEGVPIPPKSE